MKSQGNKYNLYLDGKNPPESSNSLSIFGNPISFADENISDDNSKQNNTYIDPEKLKDFPLIQNNEVKPTKNFKKELEIINEKLRNNPKKQEYTFTSQFSNNNIYE